MSVVDWISVGLALLSIPLFIAIIRTGHDERHEEDDARAFFDAHGHFPDEPAEAATPPALDLSGFRSAKPTYRPQAHEGDEPGRQRERKR